MGAAEPPRQCVQCAHFNFEYYSEHPEVNDRGVLKCEAFPKGIPDDIQEGRFDHTKPHEGDNGVQFLSV